MKIFDNINMKHIFTVKNMERGTVILNKNKSLNKAASLLYVISTIAMYLALYLWQYIKQFSFPVFTDWVRQNFLRQPSHYLTLLFRKHCQIFFLIKALRKYRCKTKLTHKWTQTAQKHKRVQEKRIRNYQIYVLLASL